MAQLRKKPEFTSIPVIVITGADLSPADHQRLNGGVQHILQKATSSQDEFLRQIRALVGRYVTPAAANLMDS
jgi:CheY-like chemotaxis protein